MLVNNQYLYQLPFCTVINRIRHRLSTLYACADWLNNCVVWDQIIAFHVRRSRGEMYSGHSHLCV